MNDLINRQAAIDVIEKWLECSDYNEAERHIMRATESILYDLPSVNQQEPCEDAISRQDAIKAIEEKAKRIKNEDTLNGLAGAVGILFDLPSYNSINSELSEDAISRQAVLDLLEDTNNGWIINEVLQLPSVNPQPCEDAISRQALLDAFGFSEKTRKWGGDHSGYNTMMLYEIQDIIESQPSVKPQESYDFAKWVATEIFDDMWEYNKDAFAEIACRKLEKLGIVRAKGDEWELIEEQERSE